MQAPTHSYRMNATYYSSFSGSRIMSRNKPLGREHTRLTISIDKTNAMRVCLQCGKEVVQIPNTSVQGIPKSLSATRLDRYLADTYVVIAQIIGGGDLFVHVHHRLSGGMRKRMSDKVSREEYSEKKKLLCEHLRRLANPFVKCKVKELLHAFHKFPDGLTGLPIEKDMLPEDTLNCLRAYNTVLTGCSAISGNNERIRSDIDEFIDSFSEDRKLWRELEFLLELPLIMQLQNKEIVDLLKRVEAGEDIADRTIEILEYGNSNFDIDELDSEINRLWSEKFPRDHDEDCSEADEYTLRTLTGQIFECAPEEERFSEMIRRGDPTNFIGKNLIIQNCWEGSGLITDAQLDEDGNYLFTLAVHEAGRGCMVRANLDGSIEAIQIVEYGLLDAIQHGFIEEGETCKILEKGKFSFGLLTVGKRVDYQARTVTKYIPGTTSSFVEVPFYKGDELVCSVRQEASKLKIWRPGHEPITFSADGGYANCRYKLIKQKVNPGRLHLNLIV